MAAAPTFAGTPRIGAVTVSTANTNRDGTGTIATVLTAGASGTLIRRIRAKATANPADSIVTIFLHDGSTYFLYDEIDLGDPAAASATVTAFAAEIMTPDLVLPTSWSIRAAITVALTAGVINVLAFGADL